MHLRSRSRISSNCGRSVRPPGGPSTFSILGEFAPEDFRVLHVTRSIWDGWVQDPKPPAHRFGRLKDEFGNYAAEIPIEALREWFSEQEWQPGTHNRYKSTLSLMFRLAIENKKGSTNPARLLKRKHEDNGRVRFLNQLAPTKSEVEYLKPDADESAERPIT